MINTYYYLTIESVLLSTQGTAFATVSWRKDNEPVSANRFVGTFQVDKFGYFIEPVIINVGTPGLYVVSISTCGCTKEKKIYATQEDKVKPEQPGIISGQDFICPDEPQAYSIDPVTDATHYIWTVPAGFTIVSGQGTTAVIVTGIASAAGNISVAASHDEDSAPTLKAVQVYSGIPLVLGAITGPDVLCKHTEGVYSVDTIEEAETYNWTVPEGWVINSGQGTNTIYVTVNTVSGEVAVTAFNFCTESVPATLAVDVLQGVPPSKPIQGDSPVDQYHDYVYSVENTPHTTYEWSLPIGWSFVSGQGTNTITVTTSTFSGNVSVTPSNLCGVGMTVERFINIQIGGG